MVDLFSRIDRIADPAVLLGTEGQAAALYFSQFNRMLKAAVARARLRLQNPQPPAPERSRQRTALLRLRDAAQGLLLRSVTVGFDPYHGFFHVGRHGKPSLALDLMEEFRPVIVDSVVLTLINNETSDGEGFPHLA